MGGGEQAVSMSGSWDGIRIANAMIFDDYQISAILGKDGPDQEIHSRPVLHTHSPSVCAGQRCCIHNPSNHHMNHWPLVHRMDRQVVRNGMKLTLSERICPHGVGHPDPDSLDWLARYDRRDVWQVHGCDGCCRPASRKSEALEVLANGLRALAKKKSQRVYGRNERGLAREAEAA